MAVNAAKQVIKAQSIQSQESSEQHKSHIL